ncbi:MAG: PIN domain-containing protein [Candidatus Bathyarchaeia archaeon]
MRSIGGLQPRFAVDSSVLIEYIVESAPLRDRAAKLLEKASTGILKLYVSPVTLSETLHVASRIYRAADVEDYNDEAYRYILWVKARTELVEAGWDIAVRAGELRKMLGIALPDCYVIATAEEVEAEPLYAAVEDEMKPILNRMKGLRTAFLEELEGI